MTKWLVYGKIYGTKYSGMEKGKLLETAFKKFEVVWCASFRMWLIANPTWLIANVSLLIDAHSFYE